MESNKIIPKKLNVPEPVAAYLAAEEAKNAEKLSLCFTDDGTVRDEGEDHHGREAIQQWKQKADAKYRYVLLPLHAHAQADEVIVARGSLAIFPAARSNWTTSSSFRATRLLHSKSDHDDNLSFSRFEQ